MSQSAEELRASLHAAFQQIVVASSLLIAHPDATWQDLVTALRSYEFVADQAAFRLHELLAVPINGVLQRDPKFWLATIEAKGLRLDGNVVFPSESSSSSPFEDGA